MRMGKIKCFFVWFLITGTAGLLYSFLIGVLSIQPMILQDEFIYFDEARKYPISDSTLPNIFFLYLIKFGLSFGIDSLTSVRIFNFSVFGALWAWLLCKNHNHINPVLHWLFPICCPILILLSYAMPDLFFSAFIIISLLTFVEFRSFLILGVLLAILCLIKPHGYYVSCLAWGSAGIALLWDFYRNNNAKHVLPVILGGLIQVFILCFVNLFYFNSFNPFIFGHYSKVATWFLTEQYYVTGFVFLATILGFKLALVFSYYSCFGWLDHYLKFFEKHKSSDLRFSDLFLVVFLFLLPFGMLCISSIFTVMTDVQASSDKAYVFLRYSAVVFLIPYFVNIPTILASNPNLKLLTYSEGAPKFKIAVTALAALTLSALSGYVNYAWNDQMALIEQSDVLNYALVLLLCCAGCWRWRALKHVMIIPILFVGLIQVGNLFGYVRYFSSIPNVPKTVAVFLSNKTCNSITVYDNWSPNAQKIFYYMDAMPSFWRDYALSANDAAEADCLVLHADFVSQNTPKLAIVGSYYITHGKFFRTL